jgi:hypothetical protein
MRGSATFVATAVFAACGAIAVAQEHEMHTSKVTGTPQWDTIKSLVGEWEGYTTKDGKKMPTHITIRMTGDGSAVMHWIDADTPHEMVTMFYMDKENLLATHYCSAHNQPRFRAVPSAAANPVVFEFTDGTNIRPGDGYMSRVVVTVVDPNHHDEEWGYDMNGTIHAATFHLTRVKASQPRS